MNHLNLFPSIFSTIKFVFVFWNYRISILHPQLLTVYENNIETKTYEQHLSGIIPILLSLALLKKIMEELIQAAWTNRALLKEKKYADAIHAVMEELDKGRLRVAEKKSTKWIVNEWVKQAILLYFGIQPMKKWDLDPFEFYDKMLLKKDYASQGVRAVPHAVARYGSFLGKNVVLMPSYVNIGAYVDEGTMVDTWATVGSCAQIGKNVHISGGVGIGGVLEPLQAAPVIIEDGCFLGSRCIVVEGALIEKEAVLGANVVMTKSTRVIDVSNSVPIESKGHIPARSVVIPGTYTKKFPAGEYQIPCALIIGKRKASTDLKTSLNDALRDFNVTV
jgi:2,3,4,5-tetrahydropyridine-2-carboxylate N-succinyltransferase